MRRGPALALLIGLAAVSTLPWLPACSEEPELTVPRRSDRKPRRAQLVVAGRHVEVELAYTASTRAMGLKHRPSLPKDTGMLFIFPEAELQRFWMQDTLIELDIAFLDDEGEILNIELGRPGVQQPGYMSAGPARFVLEMEGGWCAAAGLQAGDRIEISEDLRALAES